MRSKLSGSYGKCWMEIDSAVGALAIPRQFAPLWVEHLNGKQNRQYQEYVDVSGAVGNQ